MILPPPPRSHHVAGSGLGAEELALEVGVEGAVEHLLAHLQEVRGEVDAGVAHGDVDAAEGVEHGAEQGIDGGLPRHVGGNQQATPSQFLDLAHGALPILGGDVRHRDVGALARERQHDGAPDPARAAGNHRVLALQSATHG